MVKRQLKRVGRALVGPYGVDESHLAFNVLSDRRNGVMLDVGACWGESLAPFAHADWEIHAFEPDPQNLSRLRDAYGLADNVTIIPNAVGEQAGRMTLYASAESPGITSLAPFRESHRPTTTVEVVTLKDYVTRGDLQRVDFLKIDVEGFERDVLRGLDWSVMPEMIVLEFDDAKTYARGYTWRSLADLLTDQGYGVLISEWYPIVRYGGWHRWRGFKVYPAELDDPQAWGNLIAARNDFEQLVTRAARVERRFRVRRTLERLRGK